MLDLLKASIINPRKAYKVASTLYEGDHKIKLNNEGASTLYEGDHKIKLNNEGAVLFVDLPVTNRVKLTPSHYF